MNTANLILRPWTIKDIPTLVNHAGNRNDSQWMTDAFPYPYTESHGRAFIAFANADDPIHIFAIEWKGEVVGGIGLHFQEDIYRLNAELGYWLAEPFWGQGIITLAIEQICVFGFQTFEIHRIFARPFGSNMGSRKVLEKMGSS